MQVLIVLLDAHQAAIIMGVFCSVHLDQVVFEALITTQALRHLIAS